MAVAALFLYLALAVALAVGVVVAYVLQFVFAYPGVIEGVPALAIALVGVTVWQTWELIAHLLWPTAKNISKWGDDLGRSVQVGAAPERWLRWVQRAGLSVRLVPAVPTVILVGGSLIWRAGWWSLPLGLASLKVWRSYASRR